MVRRKIVEIDERKCNGCGQCVPSCAEGAIRIIEGKARLVSDVYCDGLGACLGHCPQDAIRVVEREAAEFDEEAARHHSEKSAGGHPAMPVLAQASPSHRGGCPGSAVRSLLNVLPGGHGGRTLADRQNGAGHASACSHPSPRLEGEGPGANQVLPGEATGVAGGSGSPSALANWPVQLHLVPPQAPFLHEADLLLVADCVPFAYPDFHSRLLRRRPVVIGCPKLDDGSFYVQKLAAILQQASIRSLTVVHMEVPCCTGLVRIAEAALRNSGRSIPLDDVTISIDGRIVAEGCRAPSPFELPV